jgi:hypothetical protein
MPLALSVRIRGLKLWWNVRKLTRAQHRRLIALGEAVQDAKPQRNDDRAVRLAAAIAEANRQIAQLEPRIARSLEIDRQDFAQVTTWLQNLVVLRGSIDRFVLRHHIKGIVKRLEPSRAEWGELALATRVTVSQASNPEVKELIRDATEGRDRLLNTRQELADLLAPLNGKLLPSWMAAIGREVAGVGRFLVKELKARWLPRYPAAAGLVAGWWVANTFTAPRWGIFSRLGIFRSDETLVSQETYERLEFWLPIVAAAVCSYLGARLNSAIQRKYAPQPELPADSLGATEIRPRAEGTGS